MMKYFLLSVLVLGMATGCLQTREQLRGHSGAGTTTDAPAQVAVASSQQQEAQGALQTQENEEQLRLLLGRIENLENDLRVENQRKLEAAKNKLDNQAAVNERFKIFEEAITRLETKIVGLEQQLKNAKTSKASAPAAKKPKGNFLGAEDAFSRKKWKEAISGYQKYRELNPKGRRYVQATYKIGVSFEELGMKTEASAFYREVIKKYPKSKFVKKAQYRLSRIK